MTINKKDIRFIKYQLKGDAPKANKELRGNNIPISKINIK